MQQITLAQMIDLVDEPNRTGLQKLYADNSAKIKVARGSKTKHQAWSGGYIGHLEEMGTMGLNIFTLFTQEWHRTFPFNLSDVMTVILIHDLEKPWKHREVEGVWTSAPEFAGKGAHTFVTELLSKYGVVLSDSQKTALDFVHGETGTYDPDKNLTNKLGAFCHSLDYLSARLFHNYPKHNEQK